MKHALSLGITASLPSIGKSDNGKLFASMGEPRMYKCRSSWGTAHSDDMKSTEAARHFATSPLPSLSGAQTSNHHGKAR